MQTSDTAPLSLMAHFADLQDPRRALGREHKLLDIVTIAILAVTCGANDLTAEVVAIDGKTLRRSQARSRQQAAIELVSAWARNNRLTLEQFKVAEDSNEITAVPELLQLLDVKGCIVTVDALNTQKETAAQIREQEADYMLALKGNHGHLHEAVVALCAAVREDRTINLPVSTHTTVEGEHGRIETRCYWSIAALDWLPGYEQWRDLNQTTQLWDSSHRGHRDHGE